MKKLLIVFSFCWINNSFSQRIDTIKYIDSIAFLALDIKEEHRVVKTDSGTIRATFSGKIIGKYQYDILYTKDSNQIQAVFNNNTFFHPSQEQIRAYWFRDSILIKVLAGEIFSDSVSKSRTFYYDPKSGNIIKRSLDDKALLESTLMKQLAKEYLKRYRVRRTSKGTN